MRTKLDRLLSDAAHHAERGYKRINTLLYGSTYTRTEWIGSALCRLEDAQTALRQAALLIPPRDHTDDMADLDEPKRADDSRGRAQRICQVCGLVQAQCACDANYVREQAEYGNVDIGGK